MTGQADAAVIAPPEFDGWPDRTLFLEVAEWASRWLEQPDGPDAGDPWMFTDEQARIVAWWYAFDERERWIFRRGTLRLRKGWGKDPFIAVLSALELCGPCRVRRGQVVEHPSPLIQIGAVSKEQTSTTLRLFPSLFSEAAKARFAVDVNKTIVYARGGRAVIQAITSSPDSAEGPRVSLAIRNEIQNWRSTNGGLAMAAVIDGNLAKSRDGSARALSVCNAHKPGEDSLGEREWDAYEAVRAGRTRARDVFYYAREAPANTRLDDEDSLRLGLRAAAGDSDWLDEDRVIAEIWDPQTAPSEARRKHLNQIVAAEDAYIDPQSWDRLRIGVELEAEETIALGFDGSRSDDHTALVACRCSDGVILPLGIWDPDRHGGEAPRDAIDAAVAQAFDRYDVVGFYSDVHPWESYIDRWRDNYGAELVVSATRSHPIGWDMRSRQMEFTRATESFLDAIETGTLRHNGDLELAAHAKNARRRPNRWGLSFGKEHRESGRKVDALAAAVLARLAYRDWLALPEKKRRRKRKSRAVFV